tara:strand:- start:892 stop:1377 length:486 start_codon:yes stop_codon:yes gene_type:complete
MLLYKRTIILYLLILLSSCGFQLRQSAIDIDKLENSFIETNDSRSIFYRKLRAELNSNNIELATSKSTAKNTITIHRDETGRRVLSVSARNVATEYEVFYRLSYSFINEEGSLNAEELELTRSYTFNENLVLGKSQEEEVLIEALASDLVRLMLRQISSQR